MMKFRDKMGEMKVKVILTVNRIMCDERGENFVDTALFS